MTDNLTEKQVGIKVLATGNTCLSSVLYTIYFSCTEQRKKAFSQGEIRLKQFTFLTCSKN